MKNNLALALASVLSLTATACPAEDYSSYSYRGIDVTAGGKPETVMQYGHDLWRIDIAASKVFPSPLGDSRLPTHLYVVPARDFGKLSGATGDMSIASSSGYDEYILAAADGDAHLRDFGIYFGYSLNLLLLESALRLPEWFRTGFLEFMAASSVRKDQVILGSYAQGRVNTLLTGKWIPLRRLLTAQKSDPALQGEAALGMYVAECWFLVHEILVERLDATEFTHYLNLIDQGSLPSDAFARSFSTSYEDLDAAFGKALQSRKIREFRITVQDEPGGEQPKKLTRAEADARLARVGVRFARDTTYAESLAKEALVLDPQNTDAMLAMALIEIKQRNYDSAGKILDGLPAELPRAESFADRGSVLRALADANRKPSATSGADPASLRHRARLDYERALALNPENLSYWSSLTSLLAAGHERDALDAFLPRAERMFYHHIRNPALAYSLAEAFNRIGNYDDALKYAVAWRNNALSAENRDQASAWIARLAAALQKRDAGAAQASAGDAPSGQSPSSRDDTPVK